MENETIKLKYFERTDAPKLAYRHRKGSGPTLVFLPGYMSDMDGGKAMAIDNWAAENGRAMLRLDYAGCGRSEGDFEDQTLTSWRDDVLALLDSLSIGPITLIGSSMGGWLMLLVAKERPEQVQHLVGIAAAPDFTDWGFTQAQKMTILSEGKLEEHSEYSDDPYVTTRIFWQSGEANRLLHQILPIDCPVRLLHGQNDTDVPWEYSVELAKKLRSSDVQTLLIKDGDHRLSRDQDIKRLIQTIANFPA